jgi:hypothetical protein
LSEAEIAASMDASSEDTKKDAGLKFVPELVALRGRISEETFQRVRDAASFTEHVCEEHPPDVSCWSAFHATPRRQRSPENPWQRSFLLIPDDARVLGISFEPSPSARTRGGKRLSGVTGGRGKEGLLP